MKPFLNDFFNTLSSRQQVRVAALLEEAKLSKEEVPKIAEKLSEMQDFSPLFLSTEPEFGLIRSTGFFTNLRDSQLRIREMYDASNLISLLIDSHQSILLSEVKALEDELVALDKEAKNYSFLLADNGAFDFAYLEPFSDELGRAEMGTAPDRASLSFGPIEKATLNSAEGVITLPQNLATSYALNATIVDGNVTAMLNNSDVSKVVTSNTQGWRASLDAPSPITSGIPLAEGHTGAQVVIEFRLTDPSPASEIKVVPFADAVQELVQVIVYPGDDEEGMEKLLVSPVELDRQYTIHFPMRSIKRFKVVLNQPAYNRISQFASVEDEYRQAYEQVQQRLKELNDQYNVTREPTFNRLYQIVSRFFNRDARYRSRARSDHALTFHTGFSGVMHPHSLRSIVNSSWLRGPWNSGRRFSSEFQMEKILLALFHQQSDLFNSLTRREVEEFNNWLSEKGLYDPEGVITTPMKKIYNEAFTYRYVFGLSSVGIGVEAVGHKGYWISKPFSADGDFGEVRIKAAEDNYRSTNSDLQNNVLTSVEYSVTNRSNPTDEDDWIPIMPIGRTTVDSERVYPDSTGKCLFRFSADGTAFIAVYKNGYVLEVDPESDFLYDNNRQGIIGVRLPVRSYTSEDIITVRYNPVRDYSTVSFESEGFSEAPLVTAYDDDGAGEGFYTTVGRNEATLAHVPYIHDSSVKASTYDPIYGLTPYQPITVVMNDGTTAVNLTNYRGGDQTSLPADGYYYHHSGKTLIFNRPIEEPFRVYYQYLKNNVRVRVVLRCNSRDFVSPKVDFYHLKAKTRRPIKERLS